jgi:hypothetical protein
MGTAIVGRAEGLKKRQEKAQGPAEEEEGDK